MLRLSDITPKNPILLLGCGKMGGAMLGGWLEQGLDPDAVFVVDPYLEPVKAGFSGLSEKKLHETVETLPEKLSPSFVVIAVKPQLMDGAISSVRSLEIDGSVILSVAAGKPVRYFEQYMGENQPIIRAMPNTPAAIGKGVTVCYANKHVNAGQKGISTVLLGAVGSVEWIEEEGMMDAVTALSGSGPAYVFCMAEAMAAAGEAIGLPPELSKKLARQTVSGAGALLEVSEESATKLRENVTSPGGTTAAALDVLMSDQGLAKIMRRAMQEAKNRSKELAD